MQLLALDLATNLGWACGDTKDGEPKSGAFRLPSTGEDYGTFAMAYHAWLIEMLKAHRPAHIVFEAQIPALGATNMTTQQKLGGLCWHTEFVASMKGLKVNRVAIGTWKSFFCGTSKFSKPKTKAAAAQYPVVKACRQRGWHHVIDDNEADALGIWCYAMGVLDPEHATRFEPLFRQSNTEERAHV